MRCYYSKSSRVPQVAPGELPGPLLVVGTPGSPWPIGLAFPSGTVASPAGGPGAGQPEQLWRLTIHDFADEVTIEGRFVLRGGVFVEVAEDMG